MRQVGTFTDTYPVSRGTAPVSKVRVDVETQWGVLQAENILDAFDVGGGFGVPKTAPAAPPAGLRIAFGPRISVANPVQVAVWGEVVNDAAQEVVATGVLRVLKAGTTMDEATLSFRLQPHERREFRHIFRNDARSGRLSTELVFQ